MKTLIPVVAGLLAALAAAPAPTAAPESALRGKRAVAAARLLVPFFEVDTSDSQGATTFFSVRNEITQPVDVRISYYATDRPQSPILTPQTVTLAGKRLVSVNVRSQPGLPADDDGFARGYVIIETLSGEAVIQGDTYQMTPGEGFATGSRLVNIDPQDPSNDLCSVFTVRMLNGGPFSGGTVFTFWLDLDVAPQDTPVFSYAVYNEAGDLRLFVPDVPASQVAFEVDSADLVALQPTSFGAVEIQLADGIRGHVAATLSALGLYSVGLEAVCRD